MGSWLTSSEHNYGDFKIKLIAYQCKFESATFYMTDHDKYEWVRTEELLNWNLAPADVPIAKFIGKN